MSLNLRSPLAVVCHDAGSANVIFPWLKNWRGQIRPVMKGPAASLWKSAFPDLPLTHDINSALTDAQMLLSGTSWKDNLEHLARLQAAKQHLKSIAVIDHWVNYASRFEREGSHQLPDEIWVTDTDALKIAKTTFPKVPAIIQPNIYVQEQIAFILPPPQKNIILYILEPVASDWGMGRAGEFVALEYAIERLFMSPNFYTLRLRPHPSEPPNKYAHYTNLYDFIEIDDSENVGKAISKADAVIGVESFALTIALCANRPVYCSLPPGAPNLRLPHKGIIEIRQFPDFQLPNY